MPDGDFRVKADQVKPVSATRNLRVNMGGEMSMRSKISRVAASCFTAMHRIHSVTRSLPSVVLEMLITSYCSLSLDYGNVVFT